MGGRRAHHIRQPRHRMVSQQPFVVDMHKLIGHQRQPRQFRHRIPAVDIAVDFAGKLPIEGIAGSAIADHRCAEG